MMKQRSSVHLLKIFGVVIFFLALFILFTQIRKPEQSGVVPVIRLTNTRISAEDAKQYVRDFMGAPLTDLYLYATYRDQMTGRAIHGFSDGFNTYDVDADTGEVFAVSFKNARDANVGPATISQADAMQRAQTYAAQHVEHFEQFTAQAELQQQLADGIYFFRWQEKLNQQVEGASFVDVRINGLTGEVAGYLAELHPTKIPIEAKISEQDARKTAADSWKRSAEAARLRLKVMLWRGEQTLVWEVNDPQTQQELFVDANTGTIVERLES